MFQMQNSLLSRFTPKEPKFFDFFKKVSVINNDAAILLGEALKTNTIEERQDYFHRIKEKEHQADLVAHEIFEALETSFITPFDREDIQELSNRLDDVVDLINGSSKRMAIYNPKVIHPSIHKLGEIIIEGAKEIDKAIDMLPTLRKNKTNLKNIIEKLHRLENEADEIYEQAVTAIFANETNAIELLKNKGLLSELERTTDAAEHVGKIIGTIIVKYA